MVDKETITMTRTQLKMLGDNERHSFTGTFEKYGSKKNFRGYFDTTLLFKDIKLVNSKKILTDHLWMNLTNKFANLGKLLEGDVIQFNARVKLYEKGYRGYRQEVEQWSALDYKLSHPTKIDFISKVHRDEIIFVNNCDRSTGHICDACAGDVKNGK
ncbi:MAG: hypothetical protein HeimC2_32130 [Candidatus Heimdallarchaeota archaeon LC_2]|nr:MAG: hypothetical protein HeimC2_32130 [Candidatus Heimdallarchaeota archaeon LC_2]